jgi:hypothetical protein
LVALEPADKVLAAVLAQEPPLTAVAAAADQVRLVQTAQLRLAVMAALELLRLLQVRLSLMRAVGVAEQPLATLLGPAALAVAALDQTLHWRELPGLQTLVVAEAAALILHIEMDMLAALA